MKSVESDLLRSVWHLVSAVQILRAMHQTNSRNQGRISDFSPWRKLSSCLYLNSRWNLKIRQQDTVANFKQQSIFSPFGIIIWPLIIFLLVFLLFSFHYIFLKSVWDRKKSTCALLAIKLSVDKTVLEVGQDEDIRFKWRKMFLILRTIPWSNHSEYSRLNLVPFLKKPWPMKTDSSMNNGR